MTKASKKIRILTITPGLNVCGGIESYVMNYYSKIKDEVEMDFITHSITDDTYKNIIEKNGNKVFVFPKINVKKLRQAKKNAEAFFKEHHNYDIVHCHMANASFIYLRAAKKYGIKVRITHSHQNKAADILSHAIRNIPLIKMGLKYTNTRFACSKLAGDYLFKKKKYYIINNAIDSNRFKFNSDIRNRMRKELAIEDDCLLIGNVGRLCPQKNQIFLIDVFSLISKEINSKLLIIGEGILKCELENRIKELNIEDKVIMISPVSDVEKYYQAMDIFVLPSLYEGLGIVNIEAQLAGLPTIVSTQIPKEAYVTQLIKSISLKESINVWKKVILETNKNKEREKNKEKYADEIIKKGYDISAEGEKLKELYIDLAKEK